MISVAEGAIVYVGWKDYGGTESFAARDVADINTHFVPSRNCIALSPMQLVDQPSDRSLTPPSMPDNGSSLKRHWIPLR